MSPTNPVSDHMEPARPGAASQPASEVSPLIEPPNAEQEALGHSLYSAILVARWTTHQLIDPLNLNEAAHSPQPIDGDA